MMCLINDLTMSLKIYDDHAALFQDLRSLIDALRTCLKTCRVADDDGGGVPHMVADDLLFNGPDDEPRSRVMRPDV